MVPVVSDGMCNTQEQNPEGMKCFGAALRLVILKNSATESCGNAAGVPFWQSCHVQRNTVREILHSKTKHK
jgi:hypothetical protein